jgi:hypothetical protein
MEPSQIPAQAAPQEAVGDSADVTSGPVVDERGCTAAELVRRQRAVAGTRKELLDALERVTRKAP